MQPATKRLASLCPSLPGCVTIVAGRGDQVKHRADLVLGGKAQPGWATVPEAVERAGWRMDVESVGQCGGVYQWLQECLGRR